MSEQKYLGAYTMDIPECMPSFDKIAKQMRINADIIKKEISEHIDTEIRRLKKECKAALQDQK